MIGETEEKVVLHNRINKYFKMLQKQILDLVEVSVPASNWEAVRSKLLRSTNDTRRLIETEINTNFSVSYTPSTMGTDIIEIRGAEKLPLTKKG